MIWQKIGFDLVILRLNAAHEPNSFTFTSRNTKPINQIYGHRFKEIPAQGRHVTGQARHDTGSSPA